MGAALTVTDRGLVLVTRAAQPRRVATIAREMNVLSMGPLYYFIHVTQLQAQVGINQNGARDLTSSTGPGPA